MWSFLKSLPYRTVFLYPWEYCWLYGPPKQPRAKKKSMDQNTNRDRISALIGLILLAGFWIGKIALQMTVISVLYYYVISRALTLPTIPMPKLVIVLCSCYIAKYAFIPPDVKRINTNLTVFLREILTILGILCTIALLSKLI